MQNNTRNITYAAAIWEATDICLKRDKSVILIGEGVPDPKGIFGTTIGLQKKYGKERVFDMPVSENGLTGICIGLALSGIKPIMTHQRVDFSLLSCDQIINNAAKWYYMFGGKISVPIVIRMIIGRGWGQGAQHSQSLQATFAHIPGLKVVMPAAPYDVKGMLIAAVEDKNPVIVIEHRWLYNLSGPVPKRYYQADLHKSKLLREGNDISVVSTSYMTIESIKAADILKKEGISVEVIDARSIKPLDYSPMVKSVTKTRRLLVCDTGYRTLGVASEIVAGICEKISVNLKTPPRKITLPDLPTPTSWHSAEDYYPTYLDIIKKTLEMLKVAPDKIKNIIRKNKRPANLRSDVPDQSFTGPF